MVKKLTKTQIVALFCSGYEKKFYLKEMAVLLGKPHQTVKPYLEALVREGVLIKVERKNITEFGPNFKDKRVFDYLTIAEKEKLADRLEHDLLLKVLFERLSEFFSKNTFVIFGSAALKPQKNSDIDLLVIGRQNVSSTLEDLESVYNRKIHKVQVFDLEKLTLTLLREVYKKHLIFNNTEQVVRFFGEMHENNKLV